MSAEQKGAIALDQDDSFEPRSTVYALKRLRREYALTVGVQTLLADFYDNPKIMGHVGVGSVEALLVMLNSFYMTKEYVNMPIPPRHVHMVKEAAKRRDVGIVTSRPSYTADFLLEKLDRHGVLGHLRAGVHHVRREDGQTKLDVCVEQGFTTLVDDAPWHVRNVVAGGIEAVGIVGTRPWNQWAHYDQAFGGEIPEAVMFASGFRHALSQLAEMPAAA